MPSKTMRMDKYGRLCGITLRAKKTKIDEKLIRRGVHCDKKGKKNGN